MTTRAATVPAIELDRHIPVWGILSGLVTLAATGGGMLWNLSGIAHDVAEMRATVQEVRADVRGQSGRLYDLETRVAKNETRLTFLENRK